MDDLLNSVNLIDVSSDDSNSKLSNTYASPSRLEAYKFKNFKSNQEERRRLILQEQKK